MLGEATTNRRGEYSILFTATKPDDSVRLGPSDMTHSCCQGRSCSAALRVCGGHRNCGQRQEVWRHLAHHHRRQQTRAYCASSEPCSASQLPHQLVLLPSCAPFAGGVRAVESNHEFRHAKHRHHRESGQLTCVSFVPCDLTRFVRLQDSGAIHILVTLVLGRNWYRAKVIAIGFCWQRSQLSVHRALN